MATPAIQPQDVGRYVYIRGAYECYGILKYVVQFVPVSNVGLAMLFLTVSRFQAPLSPLFVFFYCSFATLALIFTADKVLATRPQT